MQKFKKESGFTLIEIVIVMAIAALIMVIVFMAVSGAQKARRDTQRQSDANRFAAALEQYASNNGGAYPASGTSPGASYWTATDPSTGSPYNIQIGAPTAAGQLQYVLGSFCPSTTATASGRSYEVNIYQENGGSNCRDNH